MRLPRASAEMAALFARRRGPSRRWAAQRASAVLLVPLGIWFAASLFVLAPAPHALWVRWADSPFNALAALALLAALHRHAALGMEEVVVDYAPEGRREAWARALRAAFAASFALAALSLLALVLRG